MVITLIPSSSEHNCECFHYFICTANKQTHYTGNSISQNLIIGLTPIWSTVESILHIRLQLLINQMERAILIIEHGVIHKPSLLRSFITEKMSFMKFCGKQ